MAWKSRDSITPKNPAINALQRFVSNRETTKVKDAVALLDDAAFENTKLALGMNGETDRDTFIQKLCYGVYNYTYSGAGAFLMTQSDEQLSKLVAKHLPAIVAARRKFEGELD